MWDACLLQVGGFVAVEVNRYRLKSAEMNWMHTCNVLTVLYSCNVLQYCMAVFGHCQPVCAEQCWVIICHDLIFLLSSHSAFNALIMLLFHYVQRIRISALEVCYENAPYKFTFDVWHWHCCFGASIMFRQFTWHFYRPFESAGWSR